MLHSEGVDLLLIHDPNDVPKDWHGWVVHGHKHNIAPLIDPLRKRVNVSAEVVGYTPISINRLTAMIREADARSRTQPRYRYSLSRRVLPKRLSRPQLQEVR